MLSSATWPALLLVCVACQHEPKQAGPAGPGDTAAAEPSQPRARVELDVRSLRECEPEAYTTLRPDEYLLGVEIELLARAAGVPNNYYYASVRDQDNTVFHAGFAGCEPRLIGKPLGPGERAKGYANFRLPRNAKQLTLQYDPPEVGSPKARGSKISRKLGR